MMVRAQERYSGKPLVRLLECYVLWAIDRLDQGETDVLSAMTPKLRAIYRAEGTWQDVIGFVMRFPEEMPQQIAAVWRENVTRFEAAGARADPQTFAEQFVDENFLGD
jgi:hypothetical protein